MTIRHTAEVAADCLVGPNEERHVPVTLKEISSCRQCARGRGCGAGLLTIGQGSIELQCRTALSVFRGQRVTIETDDSSSQWLLVVLIAFGLPILGLGLGLLLGSFAAAWQEHVPSNDWPAALGGLLGLCGGVLAWQKVAPQLDSRVSTGLCDTKARIVNIVSDS